MDVSGVALMTGVVDHSCALYAVIEARWSEGPPEPFVIAYRDEKSLRDVIAAPSIVGTGFITREEALANAGCWPPVFRGSTQTLMPSIDIAEKHQQRGFSSAKRRLVDALSVADTRRIACQALRHAVAVAIVVFYSKNIVSATIRSLIGAS